MTLNLDFNLPCRTSPRWCSRGSPGGWFWNLSKCHLKNKYQRKSQRKKDNMTLNLDFDLPCRTSPRGCSRSSPGVLCWISFLQNLYRYQRKIHWKNHDKMAEILNLFNLSKNSYRVMEVWGTKYFIKNEWSIYTPAHFWENCKKS